MIAASSLPKKKACEILEISRAGFYQHKDATLKDESSLIAAIQNICFEFAKYGYRRVTKELHRRGICVNHKKIRRLMKEKKLLVKRKKTKPKTTDSISIPTGLERARR